MEQATTFLNNTMNFIDSYLPGKTISIILLLIIGFFIAKFLKRITSKLISKTGIDKKMDSSKIKISSFFGKLVYFLVLIFVFMLALERLGLSSVLEPVKNLLNGFTSFIPNIVGAGLVGYIGYMLATIISELVGLSGDTIQKLTPKLSLPENINLTNILKKIVFIFIFIPLLIQALNILNMDAISAPATNILNEFFNAIPKILLATIILIVFVVGGKFLSALIKDLLDSLQVNNVLEKANLGGIIGKTNVAKVIANIVYAFIILFGLMTVL